VIFYHGTTLESARSIQREGLKPHRENAYRIETNGIKLRNVPSEKLPYIYLTTDQRMAELYADFRTQYAHAPRGAAIDGGGIYKPVKLTTKRWPNAKPAIVELDIPQTIVNSFRPDPQEDRGGYTCLCIIPPQYIRSIAEVPYHV
jgi:hypothetical protein